MAYAIEQVAQTLKAARQGKGLSQRALSKLAGVPQSHISRIENGVVDLRLSSLVEIARVLDLEVTLVPRKSVPAVQSIVRNSRWCVFPGIRRKRFAAGCPTKPAKSSRSPPKPCGRRRREAGSRNPTRAEERRVGKDGISRWSPYT